MAHNGEVAVRKEHERWLVIAWTALALWAVSLLIAFARGLL
jgi:hypothetical protein